MTIARHPLPAVTSGDARRDRSRVAVLPVGSFEQHGPCLPLSTDTVIAQAIADRICLDYDLFPLPPVTISCSHEHSAFPGTLSLQATTLHSVVSDIWKSLDRDGWTGLVIVNGHGGNHVLSNLAQELNADAPRVVLFPTGPDLEAAGRAAALQAEVGRTDMHAGEFEVSLLLHVAPHLVRPGYEAADWETEEWRSGLHLRGIEPYAPQGVIGRPSAASAEKGRVILDSLSSSCGRLLAYLSGNPVGRRSRRPTDMADR
ncbi:creatininase family protein [Microbispora sp. H10949]|uniref:creatininase family protein n=1 Tax=Microbispora sp. H10949 TaxID=2729111 RepID=UPI002872EC23|nr:creatininase family protein [Microbispora sp. H10949]